MKLELTSHEITLIIGALDYEAEEYFGGEFTQGAREMRIKLKEKLEEILNIHN